ncbi:MAG: hypothetical protein HY962_11130 [Ignavibacteriae bacterium]|nr:hypothetical protein [Ignavibacteriota bacterium]
MAKVNPLQARKKVRKGAFIQELELPQRLNYVIIGIGILTIILGYIVMAAGDDINALSVTISPLILFLGYCVIVPIGIIYRRPQENKQDAKP